MGGATVLAAPLDDRGGTIAIALSNDGGASWVAAAPGGAEVVSPAVGTDLRARFELRNETLDPVRLLGLSIGYRP